jgi:CotH kinase protein
MNLTTANSVTAKQLRDGLHSVFIMGLTEGSSARKIAEQAAGATNSYLRGKDVFGRAFEDLVALPDSNSGGQLRLKSTNGAPTQAGGIVAEWQKVSADRTTLFDGIGATGPTIFEVQVNGIDAASLWQEDQNKDPRVVKGGSGASMAFFETTPSLRADKKPDAANGVFQALQGEEVSVKRRGNTSRWDRKINLSIALDDDPESGFPKQLNLLNCIRDPSYERVRLSWFFMAEAKCPAEPRAYAELTLNGEYRGTYVAMPPPDGYFFQTLFPKTQKRAVFRAQYGDIPGGATLEYRGPKGTDYFTPGSNPSSRTYESRLDTEDDSYDALAQFVATVCNNSKAPTTEAFAEDVLKVFDVEGFLRVMAVINLLGAWDNYYLNAQNYLLHLSLDGATPYVTFCPYDMDSVLGVSWPGQKRNWQEKDVLFRGSELGNVVLVKRLLQNTLFRAYYCDFMAWFVEARFTPEVIAQQRSQLWKVLEQSVYLESSAPWGSPPTFRPWTNDEVYRHAVLNQAFDAPGSSAVAGLQVLGIGDFVQTRRKTVAAQLKAETLGKSGVDFTSKRWSLSGSGSSDG